MKVTLDGKVVEFFEEDRNIVEVADRAKVRIMAPCLRAERRKGCCKACVVEADGERKYACATKPVDGMNIIMDREDLKQIRRERLEAYRENQGNSCSDGGCDCSSGPECPSGTNCSHGKGTCG